MSSRGLCAECRAELVPQPAVIGRPEFSLVAWRALPYTTTTRNVIVGLKTFGSTHIARSLAPTIEALAELNATAVDADLIVVPPSRPAAYRERGFRPIELVASAAGLRVTEVFRIEANVRDQRALSAAARRENLRNAFSPIPNRIDEIKGARVLLLDDVITTGATMARLRDAVQRAGGHVVGRWALTSVEQHSAARSELAETGLGREDTDAG